MDYMLSNDIYLCKPAFYCKDGKCECHEHKYEIDMLCNAIIDSCIVASQRTIPVNSYASANRETPAWSESVEPERERSLFRIGFG